MQISCFTAHVVSTLAINMTPETALLFAPLFCCCCCFFCCISRHFSKLQVQVYQSKKGLCSRQLSSLSF